MRGPDRKPRRHSGAQPIAPSYALVPAGETWRDDAACRNHPTLKPETWDDSVIDEQGRCGTLQRSARIAAAIAVCKTCPVCLECLRDVDLEWDEGIRGGIDLRELRRKRYLGRPSGPPFGRTAFGEDDKGTQLKTARGGAANAATPGPRPRKDLGDSA